MVGRIIVIMLIKTMIVPPLFERAQWGELRQSVAYEGKEIANLA